MPGNLDQITAALMNGRQQMQQGIGQAGSRFQDMFGGLLSGIRPQGGAPMQGMPTQMPQAMPSQIPLPQMPQRPPMMQPPQTTGYMAFPGLQQAPQAPPPVQQPQPTQAAAPPPPMTPAMPGGGFMDQVNAIRNPNRMAPHGGLRGSGDRASYSNPNGNFRGF